MKSQTIAVMFVLLTAGYTTSGPAAEPAASVGGFHVLGMSAGDVSVQEMGPFTLGKWEDDDQLWWKGAAPGEKLELEVQVKTAGLQRVRISKRSLQATSGASSSCKLG